VNVGEVRNSYKTLALNDRDHKEDKAVDNGIILKWPVLIYGEKEEAGLVWLSEGPL
jgi:hypothetical protein